MGRRPTTKPIPAGTISARLTEIVAKFGGKSNLARESGTSLSALSRCLEGGDPSVSTARSICAAAGVSLDWFLAGRTSADHFAVGSDSLLIPFYAAEASAGPGLVPENEADPIEFMAFPLGALPLLSGLASDLFALHAKGDSMVPTIPNGSLLIANRADQQPREGIYVVSRGDSLLVKRTQPREHHMLRLKSDNEQYDTEEIDLKAPDHGLRILGRVIWVGHSI